MSGKLALVCLMAVAVMVMKEASGCLHPASGCECTFYGYPCYDKFSYGCKNGYCWSQCVAILAGCKEWCYVKSEATGNWLLCSSNEDCKDGADCALSKCSGGCTLASGYERYRDVLERRRVVHEME